MYPPCPAQDVQVSTISGVPAGVAVPGSPVSSSPLQDVQVAHACGAATGVAVPRTVVGSEPLGNRK